MLAPPDQTINYSFGFSSYQPVTPNSTYQYNDWKIEQMPDSSGSAILSSDTGPLYIRYVSNDITEGNFDSSFAEAFAASLAISTCEEITQSNDKLKNIEQIYIQIMGQARQRNAYEKPPVRAPVDPYIIVRM